MSTSVFNKIILLSTTDDNEGIVEFKQIYSIDPKYVGQAITMAGVFQGAIESVKIQDKDCLRFNFSKALDIVKNHSEMAIVGVVDQTISQTSSEVSVMVSKVIELLNSILHVTLTDTQKKSYEDSIAEAFTNLSTQSEDAWIFWQHEEAHKTTYQYNIFFAIQNSDTGSVMLALPMSLTINVNLEKKGFCGLL